MRANGWKLLHVLRLFYTYSATNAYKATQIILILYAFSHGHVGECIQKFPDWPPGARTANCTAVTRCSCIAILWVILVSFAAITLCIASQRVLIVVYFVVDSVRKFWIHPRISLQQAQGLAWPTLFQKGMHLISVTEHNSSSWVLRLFPDCKRFTNLS
jgi:hypothetical protein